MCKIILDFFAFSSALSIPIFSILFFVFRIPAVSINLNCIPSIFILSSITSLVVPSISETIALSSLRRVFNSVDFPEFGAPIIATGIPFFIAFPNSNELINFFNSSFILFNKLKNFFLSANSTSSSEKSSSSSTREANSIS